MKDCKYCGESIQDQAIKCRYCGEMLMEEQIIKEKNVETGGSIIPTNSEKDTDKTSRGSLEKTSNDYKDNKTHNVSSQSYFDNLSRFFFDHNGRINRKEYIMGHITLIGIVILLCSFIMFLGILVFGNLFRAVRDDTFSGIFGFASLIIFMGAYYSSIVLHIKRFHDINRSGFFVLLPFYNFIAPLFVPGDMGKNRFGEAISDTNKNINFIKLLITLGYTILSLVILVIISIGIEWLSRTDSITAQDFQQETKFELSFCDLKGDQYVLPFDAHCTPNDPNNAWRCNDGYYEAWGEGKAKGQQVCVDRQTNMYSYYID